MSCRYYGKNGMFGVLIAQRGNQCALIVQSYSPCQLEIAGVPVDENTCLVVKHARQIHGLVDLLEWPKDTAPQNENRLQPKNHDPV